MRRHVRVVALEADLLDAAFGQRRENHLVLAPFLAQRFLPVVVGLDAVAVADVHGGRAGQAPYRNLKRLHAPVGRFTHIDIEGRLVELDDVDAVGLQRKRFLVQQFGKGHCHLHLIAVKLVGHRVDDGHGPGQRELDFFIGVRTQNFCFCLVHPPFQLELTHHLRHHGVVAVVADAHLDLVIEVNAFDLLEKAVHKMLARLLAVANHVQARVFLRLDPEQRRIGLGLSQFSAFGLPLRPELVGF